MRLLYENEIYNATLEADTVNANYPITNLQNDSLKKIYMAAGTSAVITATMTTVGTVNCCYIGYTNAASAVLALYNSSDTLLSTIALDTSRGGKSFTSVSSVSYVKLSLTGTENIYLGGFGFGNNYKMPDPQGNLVLKPLDNSTRNYSNDGQLYINRVNILHQLNVTYGYKDIDIYNEILSLWESLEHPVWIDPYEENTGMINPMWVDVTMDDSPKQSRRLYTFAHNYREVR